MALAHTGLAVDEAGVFADFVRRIDVAGAEIAEIGGSFPVDAIRRHGVARWWSIDPHRAPEVDASGVRQVLDVRAEAMPLPDASVDAVFSCNAFQFIDVATSLAQVRRVLRPGGTLYAHFGPIWSATDGHQLEYVSYAGRPLAFWSDTLLPPWSHLAYSAVELRALLQSALPTELAELLVRHVYESTTINRLFFEDYVQAALDSGLEWIEVCACDDLDYPIATPPYDRELERGCDPDELSVLWTKRRGRTTRLGPRDVRMILRRPSRPTTEGVS